MIEVKVAVTGDNGVVRLSSFDSTLREVYNRGAENKWGGEERVKICRTSRSYHHGRN